MKIKILLLFFTFCISFNYAQKKTTHTKKKANITNRKINVETPSNNVDGYESAFVTTGDLNCSNIIPKYDYAIETELAVKNIGNTDLVTKLMNQNEDTAYRIVYIRPKETVFIKNIPQGIYYLKHAAGTEWFQKNVDNKCIGIFKFEHGYYMGDGLMNFNLTETVTETSRTISTPTYQLNAGVVVTKEKTGERNKISSAEFNK